MGTNIQRTFGLVLASVALSCGAPLADATIEISLAGEAFDGPPEFELRMGGKAIGSGVLDAAIDTEQTGRLFANAKPRSYLQNFVFTVPDDLFKPDTEISVVLTNDKYRDEEIGRDRNLFVESITVNGLQMLAADLKLFEGKEEQTLDFQAGLMPVYESASVAVAMPPEAGWPLTDVTVGLATSAAAPAMVALPPMPFAPLVR